jgi:hypothetical protein
MNAIFSFIRKRIAMMSIPELMIGYEKHIGIKTVVDNFVEANEIYTDRPLAAHPFYW